MTVYPVSNRVLSHSQPKTPPDSARDDATHWLNRAARLERRLELGHGVDDRAHEWLHKPSQLPRLTFWLECLHRADVDGVVLLDNLATWQLFDTARKRAYLLSCLESYGLVVVLDSPRGRCLRVTA